MNDLIDFFEAIYFEEVTITETETHTGYTSERYSYSGTAVSYTHLTLPTKRIV